MQLWILSPSIVQQLWLGRFFCVDTSQSSGHGLLSLCETSIVQIELRVLAHLSGDAQLVQLLRRAGAGGDAFNAIASTWLGSGGIKQAHGPWGGGCCLLETRAVLPGPA